MTSGGPHLKAEKRMAGGVVWGDCQGKKKRETKKKKDNEIKEENSYYQPLKH